MNIEIEVSLFEPPVQVYEGPGGFERVQHLKLNLETLNPKLNPETPNP